VSAAALCPHPVGLVVGQKQTLPLSIDHVAAAATVSSAPTISSRRNSSLQ